MIFTFNLGYIEAGSSLLFILEGVLFWLIAHVIFNGFNINVIFFISWKPYVVFVKLVYHRCSNDLLDVDLIKENKLGGCQIWKLFFLVLWWFMSYFHLLPFVNNKQYEEVKMSRVVVFVYIFEFDFALSLSTLEVCWAWSNIASLVDTLHNFTLPHYSYLVVFSELWLF